MANAIDLKKVAGEVLDAIRGEELLSLHDARYHGGRYRGGKCLYREKYYNADKIPDDGSTPPDVDEEEGRIESARHFESTMVETDFSREFGIDQKKGMRRQFLEPDANGWNQLEVVCRADTPDTLIDEKKARDFFKKRGYEFKGMRIETESAKTVERSDGKTAKNGKDKRVFKIDVYRPEKFATMAEHKDDVGEVVSVGEGEIDDDRANEMMKRYGIKREGGSFSRRTGEDNRRDRARKYLGIVGDWEGQSTREDAKSESWEKRRLASMKRAKEDKAREDGV